MIWLLNGDWEFPPPKMILSGITPKDACRRVQELPHSIAKLVAHMHWWQEARIEIAKGGPGPDFSKPVADWPDVSPDEWEGLATAFLAGMKAVCALAADEEALAREVFRDRDVGNMLVSHTTHNAWHLGQVVMLRRLQGTWPPEDGGTSNP